MNYFGSSWTSSTGKESDAVLVISSAKNPRIRRLRQLRKKRQRDRLGLYIIEGYREIQRAFQAKRPIREIYFCPKWFLKNKNEWDLLQKLEQQGALPIEVSPSIFQKISYRDRPDGLIALGQRYSLEIDLSSQAVPEKAIYLILEKIEKPGNLGAILRSADAFSIEAVFLVDPITDPFNPNVIRASTGVLFGLNLHIVSLEELVGFVYKHGIEIIAADPMANTPLSSLGFPKRCAIAVGSEQYGLSQDLRQKAHRLVHIPMAGMADSLNVSTAAAIFLYEAYKAIFSSPSPPPSSASSHGSAQASPR